MKNDEGHWIVGPEGIRPAGKPDTCFYCRQKLGTPHTLECAVRTRTVIVKLEIEMLMVVPEHWNDHDIEFHENEGSFCANNFIPRLDAFFERMTEKDQCLCDDIVSTYVREATGEDEAKYGVYIKDEKS